MSILPVFTRRLATAAAACLVAVAAAPSQAAIIASFDPAFGPSILNLGFRGTITLDVTPGCYTLGTGFQFTGGTCQITAQSAEVNFYNSSTNSNNISTVDLAGSFFDASYVFGAYFDPLTGQITGLDTNDSGRFNVSVTDTNPIAPIDYNNDMLLYFSSGTQPINFGRINALAVVPAATIPGVGGAFLVDCSNVGEGSCQSGDPTNTSNPGRLTFTTVPEPASVSLGLIGLVGLAATRRRARKSAGRAAAL